MALTGQTVGELCANCLLKLALEPQRDEILELGKSSSVQEGSTRVRYFGDYELVEEIARGGMGVVYKARQVSLNRIVALKMIRAADFSSPASVERFQTEAEAAARLEHPNIVPIYEIGTHESQHYFSMRFVEGGTLAKRIAGEKRRKGEREQGHPTSLSAAEKSERPELAYPPKEAARLMMKVARAMHHAHQRGILHRDLKPGNILLDAAGEPYVADFGLAKLLEHDSTLTQSATVLGTPAYMAPEQADGQMKDATTAVDIYSLGAILYELLAGRPPFVGRSSLEVLAQVREREPTSPQSFSPELARDLAVICLKCLEKNPARRYGSAEALAEELQRWLADEPIQARRTTPPERAWKWARRKPVVAGLLAVILVVGQVGLVGILLQTRRANREATKARAESQRAENELWKAHLTEARALRLAGGTGARVRSSALMQRLILRPDLTEKQVLNLREETIAQLALVDIAPPTHWISNLSGKGFAWNAVLDRYLWDMRSNQVELREFPSERVLASLAGPSKAGVQSAVLSADNQFVAVLFNPGAEVRVWHADTGQQIVRTTGAERIKISPDNRTLLAVTARGIRLQLIEENGSERILQGGRRGTEAEFSPDSKYIAVMRAGLPNEVQIWDANSGETCGTFIAGFSPHHVAWHPQGRRLALGGDGGQVELHDLALDASERFLASRPFPLQGHIGSVQRIEFTPDGERLVTYAWDGSSIVWDLISGRQLLREQRVEMGEVSSGGDRIRLLRRSSESVVNLIGRTGYRTVAWADQPRPAHGVWVSPDGRIGVVSYESADSRIEGDCIIFDLLQGGEMARFKGVWATFSSDSQTLFTFERPRGGNRVRRYDVSAKNLVNRPAGWNEGKIFYEGGANEINTGAISRDGRTLVIAATDAVLFVDTLGERPVRSWAKSAYSLELSGDGKWVATSFVRQPDALRAIESGAAVFRAPNGGEIRFSEDSRWMATIDPTGIQLRPLDAPPFPAKHTIDFEAPGAFAFSPDNRMFAVVFDKTHLRLYETATGRELATLSPPHLAAITGGKALTFSPDGHWLLAAKNDGETVAWNLPILRGELAKLGLDWNDQQK